MLELGILKTWNSTTYKAGVQLVGSLTTYLDNISVSVSIPSSAMVVGNYVLVAIPGGNPRDACVVASWPAGSSGGGGGGTKIQDADGDTSWDVEESADEDKIHGKVKGVEAFLLDDVGILTLANQTSAKAYRHAIQVIPKTTWTTVLHNVASWDIHGNFDIVTNHRFDVAVDGLYLIIAQDHIYNMEADTVLITRILVNAADVASGRTYIPYAGAAAGTLAITMMFLTAGQYVRSQVYHTNSVAMNIATYDLQDYLAVAKIA